jgi:hypothetical protein
MKTKLSIFFVLVTSLCLSATNGPYFPGEVEGESFTNVSPYFIVNDGGEDKMFLETTVVTCSTFENKLECNNIVTSNIPVCHWPKNISCIRVKQLVQTGVIKNTINTIIANNAKMIQEGKFDRYVLYMYTYHSQRYNMFANKDCVFFFTDISTSTTNVTTTYLGKINGYKNYLVH